MGFDNLQTDHRNVVKFDSHPSLIGLPGAHSDAIVDLAIQGYLRVGLHHDPAFLWIGTKRTPRFGCQT